MKEGGNSLIEFGWNKVVIPQDLLIKAASVISTTPFTFKNNHNRSKLKFNSSFFESDAVLKKDFYDNICGIFLPFVHELMGNYDVLISNYWEKLPSDGSVLVHQNWAHVDEQKYRSYSIWIPMQDTDEKNGTMWVIPKSHKVGSKIRGINMEFPVEYPFLSIADKLKKSYMIPVPLSFGEAIIIDDALVHYTGENNSNSPRKAIQLVVKPQQAEGRFYFKYRERMDESNVEVFLGDADFYHRLNLIAGATEKPNHGISLGNITHQQEIYSLKSFWEAGCEAISEKPADVGLLQYLKRFF